MGMDMYCIAVPIIHNKTVLIESVNDLYITNNYTTIKYWRNNKHLHNWMHRLFQKHKKDCQEFNLEVVQLTEEDILNLEQDILTNKIIQNNTSQFYSFLTKLNYEKYVDDYNEKFKKEDLNFIMEAKISLEDNKELYYYSSY